MSRKKRLSFVLSAIVILFAGARLANACSCAAKPTALDEYEWSGVVVIARAVSVEKAEAKEEEEKKEERKEEKAEEESDEKAERAYSYGGVISTKMVVEKVFKGGLKIGDEMVFAQGGGADCIWTFDEKDVDKQYLFYLREIEREPKIWFAGTCGRSSLLEYAAEDLLYLNKLNKVRGKTRISGIIWFEEEGWSVAGRKIRITGANKTYELKTDKNGVFEIYDVPAGKYLVETEVPAGWKLNSYGVRHFSSFTRGEDDETLKRIPIMLEAKKHVSIDISFDIDNAIRGKVFGPDGKVMKDVCLNLIPAQGQEPEYFYEADCTEADGTFEITEIPPGSYLLVINKEGKISSSEPFRTFYYPNVFEREKATTLTISAGQFLEGINVHAPLAEETVAVEGVFLYSDGKPVIGESVVFEPEKTKDNIEADARAQTDSQGRFSIKILKGSKGQLYGEMYTYIGEFENCAKLEAAIKKTGRDNAEMKTPALEIQAENNLYNVELKYPFPGCKKAKTSY